MSTLRRAWQRLHSPADGWDGDAWRRALHDDAVLRLAVVAGLLALGLLMARAARPPAAPLAPPVAEDQARADHVFFADVEGWYRVTRSERAVASPFDLRLTSLPDALPVRIGEWSATDLPMHPQVAELYGDPEVAFQRAYQNAAGDVVWLTLLGHRGPPSFHLFEHTPTICYPLQGWTMLRESVDTIPLQGGSLYAQRGLARNEADGAQIAVFYWYLWDTEARDPKDGILSIRVSAPITTTEERAAALLKQDFIPRLFPTVVPWRRF